MVAKRGPEKIEYCKLQLISNPTLIIPPSYTICQLTKKLQAVIRLYIACFETLF